MSANLNMALLRGMRVIDLAGEPLAMTGRLLADMGADVVKLEPAGGDPLRRAVPLDETGTSLRFMAWQVGKTCQEYEPNDTSLHALFEACDAVIETPGFPGALELPREFAPQAVWLKATPFGLDGPRATWRASDLGIMAACGNMHCTGDADRAPLRCSEPAGYAHCAAEAAFAIISGIASGRPQLIDMAMQEAVMIANMGGAAQFPKTGRSGQRQGAALGGTREIWPCKDGFVSFGLRGGPARVGNFKILLEQLRNAALATPAWTERDWSTFNPYLLEAGELRAIEEPLQAYFARHTMRELYDLAVTTNLMLAPANSAKEILINDQLNSRGMFERVGGVAKFPARFFVASSLAHADGASRSPTAASAAGSQQPANWPPRNHTHARAAKGGVWHDLKILEFGSGAAGPIATRYFSEHGAQVIRIESAIRPDFLRVMALGSGDGIEGSPLFDVLNPGKLSIALNLKHAAGKAIALKLVDWADAIVENFAPKVMKGWGLDYPSLAANQPGLVMLSTCLNGQTGPHRDYPGFGGQGAALCGYNFLTGWADRAPVGPFGTITDSLSPRFAASALAAALLYQRRTGEGLHLDISQVEVGVYSLSPWLLEEAIYGQSHGRNGNHNARAVPHGAYPCSGSDQWIAIACWSDAEWQRLAETAGLDGTVYADLGARLEARDDIERAISDWTSKQDAHSLAAMLQAIGIEAVPVVDFEYLLEHDPQLQARNHFIHLERAETGPSIYERNGFRFSDAPSTITQPTPLLGEHTNTILTQYLGLSVEDINALRNDNVLT